MKREEQEAIAEIIAGTVEFINIVPGHCYNCKERIRNVTNNLADYFYGEDDTFNQNERDEFLRIAGYNIG